MCGLAGIVCRNELCVDSELAESIQSLVHRGPDSGGVRIMAGGQVGLGHRRLSIIDLSETGAQPMSNEDSTIWVTFNGEIYNYKALRRHLTSKGHIFRSQSDTEVLVHGYEEWGTGLVDKLEGMFAFALWDERSGQLLLARDRFGVKPLFYYLDDKVLIFSSELKGLYPFRKFIREMDYTALIDYLHYYVIPQRKTIWKNTFKLLPGHFLVSNLQLDVRVSCYWKLIPGNQVETDKDAIDHVNQLLSESAEEYLESDVPVGIFLSSGYDSSALVAYTGKFKKDINTFSIGFRGSHKTEHKEAALIADHFGTNHFELVLDEDYMDILEDLWQYYDEPYAVSSMVSYYYVSRLASQHNKVVFAGDGGDEVFGGYSWYREIVRSYAKRSWWNKLFSSGVDELRSFYQQQYFRFMGSELEWVREVLNKDVMNYYPDDVYWAFDLPTEQWRLPPMKLFQLLDFKYFIPDVALPRADRSSMANSLEVRVPLLNHKLAEYLMNLNLEVYYRKGVKKYLLHENIKNRLPDSILNLPKRGFGNPLDPFFAKKDQICEQLANGYISDCGIFKRDLKFESITKKQLWLLFNLELWWSRWNK